MNLKIYDPVFLGCRNSLEVCVMKHTPGGGGTPGNSCWSAPPGSPNPSPIWFQTKTCLFPHPFSELASKILNQQLCRPYLDYNVNTKMSQNVSEFAYHFLSYSFGIETKIRSYTFFSAGFDSGKPRSYQNVFQLDLHKRHNSLFFISFRKTVRNVFWINWL